MDANGIVRGFFQSCGLAYWVSAADNGRGFAIIGNDPSSGPCSLGEVLVHMAEEYARHNGHADLLRERIDGTTGD